MRTPTPDDAGSGSSVYDSHDEPLATPSPDAPDPHGDRARHLALSAEATPPLHVEAILAERPTRQSRIASTDPAAQQQYHRDRFRSRGHEALTPGADLDLSILPIVRRREGRFEFAPRAFCTTSAEVFYSPSYSLIEKHLWAYLLNHRCFETFRRTGEIIVQSVRLTDVAATAGVSPSTVSRAVARLVAKRRLTRKRRGLGKTNVYILAPFESGASVYPTGHPRSARKRVESLVRKALGDRRSAEALLLQTALGFSLDGHDEASLLPLLWRRLDRAVESLAPAPGCPHAVDNEAPVTAPVQNRFSPPEDTLPPYEGIKPQ